MEILSEISPLINGGISAFNLYILFKIISIEKDLARERSLLREFRDKEDKNNQEIKNRLLDIELELSKRFSTWGKKYAK